MIRSLDVDGTAIAVHDSGGRGAPIVLVHGNSLSSRAFERQLRGALGARFRLLAIDLPGHGQSARATDPAIYSIPGFAALVVEAATRLDALHAVFAGWSLGGHVVLEAAPLLPRAAGFCIFGAPPLGNPPAMDRAFLPHPVMADLFKADLTDDEIHARVAACLKAGAAIPTAFVDDIRASDPVFRTAFLDSLSTIGFRDEVAVVRSLSQPLAILHGAHDQVVNLSYIKELSVPALWRGSVQEVDDAGHSPFWEAPEAFDALVGGFADEVAS